LPASEVRLATRHGVSPLNIASRACINRSSEILCKVMRGGLAGPPRSPLRSARRHHSYHPQTRVCGETQDAPVRMVRASNYFAKLIQRLRPPRRARSAFPINHW
jgi:hypothetical protein